MWQARNVDLLVWVAAMSRASVLSGYVEAATAAMGADLPGDAESVAARFVSWLRETSRSWLVVLDDLSEAQALEGLWPEGPAGRVLITTSSSAAVFGGHRARVLPVGVFSTREAMNYMMGRLTADPDQRIGAMGLVADLGGEPVALAQAIAVIASSALTCREYGEYFEARRKQLAQAGDDPSPVAVTWTLSLEQADRLSPGGGARLLLALAALLDGHGIPGTIFTTSAVYGYLAGVGAGDPADRKREWGRADRERAWAALLVLEQTGLLAVDQEGTGATVWISHAVQAAVRAALPMEMLDRAVRAAADALLEVWPDNAAQGWLAGALQSCVASLMQASGDLLWQAGCHPLLVHAGRSLVDARLTGPAAAYWKELAAVSDRILGADHPDTEMAAEELADAYMKAGQAAEAIPWFQWVLAGRIRALGQDHVGTIAARHSLGHALVTANQLSDAATVLERAVGDYERVCGPDHLDTLRAREDLAAAYSAAAQFPNAISLYRRTLADRERIQGSRHPDTSTTRERLADAYLAAGRYREARSQYKRALADRERVLGPDHLDTIAARGTLGSAYYASGRMAAALQLYEQTLAGYERVLGVDHRDTLAYRANLATVYYKVGRLSEAIASLRDTVVRCERVLPPGDPLAQTARESLKNIAGD
jgi:tetratricopeptide (TPR) repeat protein